MLPSGLGVKALTDVVEGAGAYCRKAVEFGCKEAKVRAATGDAFAGLARSARAHAEKRALKRSASASWPRMHWMFSCTPPSVFVASSGLVEHNVPTPTTSEQP